MSKFPNNFPMFEPVEAKKIRAPIFPLSSTPSSTSIDANSFYCEFYGHKNEHLEILLPLLRADCEHLIWTAGDSSLDNKFWIKDTRPAVGVYGNALQPPRSLADVTYWLNYVSAFRYDNDDANSVSDRKKKHRKYAAINTAVEATTLNERTFNLRPQDIFLRDNISSEDVLIVSIGGNDIAMCPTPCTILSMAGLMCLPTTWLANGRSFGAMPCDDYCCGCGPSLASCACSSPPCLGYLKHLFGTRTQMYIEALTSKTRPKKILVCMIYYPGVDNVPSWANTALGALGYNHNPEKLQLLIRKVFEEATSSICITGTQVIPVPLFVTLDGSRKEDYVGRVEPSAIGGMKMAEQLLDIIHSDFNKAAFETSSSAPTSSFIKGR